MNGYLEYKLIKMHPDDAKMTIFWSPKAVFRYQVMSFSLRMLGPRKKWEATVIFKEMLGNIVGCYVDDLVVKSCQRIDHLEHLGIVLSSANID